MEILQIVLLAWVLITDGGQALAALIGTAPLPPPRATDPAAIIWIDPAQESEIPF